MTRRRTRKTTREEGDTPTRRAFVLALALLRNPYRRVRAEDVAEGLGVSVRTAYRMLSQARAVGLAKGGGRRGYALRARLRPD